MGQSLARFRELTGIDPATEARLHEKGIYTWEALGAAAAALAAVRGDGDTARDVADIIAARCAEAGGDDAVPRLPDGERLEAFVLRIAMTEKGEPQRAEVTHVRTMDEQVAAGWNSTKFVDFIEQHAGIQRGSAPHQDRDATPATPQRRQESSAEQSRSSVEQSHPSAEQVVVLDAGKTIGGTSHDIDLMITNTGAAGGEFRYCATLAARPLGTGDAWTTVASGTGTGSPPDELALKFPAVRLPTGVHRLRLRLDVTLPAPATGPPALELT